MSTQPMMEDQLRARILADPAVLLEDRDLMRALVAATEPETGGKVVDLRSVALARLEARLGRLEDTHRSVIAAAYDNLAGTNQVHRAVLRLMDATKFEDFLRDLAGDVADTLRVDAMRLILESEGAADDAMLAQFSDVLVVADPGYTEAYITRGRDLPARPVTLRQTGRPDDALYGALAPEIGSEACLRLDFGPGRLPGMLVMGARDPQLFTPQQGTDLLGFFAGVFERAMRRWLA